MQYASDVLHWLHVETPRLATARRRLTRQGSRSELPVLGLITERLCCRVWYPPVRSAGIFCKLQEMETEMVRQPKRLALQWKHGYARSTTVFLKDAVIQKNSACLQGESVHQSTSNWMRMQLKGSTFF